LRANKIPAPYDALISGQSLIEAEAALDFFIKKAGYGGRCEIAMMQKAAKRSGF
jgi:hypothetical protein